MKFFRFRLFVEGMIIGTATGFLVALLRYILDEADVFRPEWFRILHAGNVRDWLISVAWLILAAVLIAKMISIDSQVAGSGIPQLKGVLQKRMKISHWFRLLTLKFSATILGIASGLSLGKAGLSLHFGACLGVGFERLQDRFSIHRHQHSENFLLLAGSSAGLSSVFSAPLAGMIFCVEELQKKSSPEVLIVTMSSSISSVWVVDVLFGVRPVFSIPSPHVIELGSEYLLLVVLGIFCGLFGICFTKCLLISSDFYDRHVKSTDVRRYLFPFLMILPIGLTFPELLGCGNVLVNDLIRENFSIELLMIFFAGKFLFTMICFGTGTPGGIFLPLLVLGAIVGNIFALMLSNFGLIDENFFDLFIVFGMAGYFSSVIKAPITGSILIMEITGSFSCLMNVICVSIVAYTISDLFGGIPAYDALLNRSLKKTR